MPPQFREVLRTVRYDRRNEPRPFRDLIPCERGRLSSRARRARGEFIVAIGGFLLLFNLIFLPLPTLICAGLSALLTIIFMNLFINRCGELHSDDMTMVGNILEFAVWVTAAILIG